eukprot:Skav229321  [mRNA]  locus=scaffold2688:16303:17551:- [translate_table: standard]
MAVPWPTWHQDGIANLLAAPPAMPGTVASKNKASEMEQMEHLLTTLVAHRRDRCASLGLVASAGRSWHRRLHRDDQEGAWISRLELDQ